MAARVQLPKQARRGEVIEIRIVIQHVMETGYRRDNFGRAIAKNVINAFTARYNGAIIFSAELGSGIAANPALSFFTVADTSGELAFDWVDDEGRTGSERVRLTVTG